MTDKKLTVDDLFEALVNLSIDDLGAGRVLIENYRESQRAQAVEEYKREQVLIELTQEAQNDGFYE